MADMLSGQKAEASLRNVPLELIDFSPYQIRSAIDDGRLHELAVSMQRNGLAQPILLRPVAERFQLVAGERRYRAAKVLGWTSIPAVVRELSDVEAALLLLIEDQQRQDASPLDRARGLQRLKEKFALGQEEIAQRLGVGQATVSRLFALLKEPPEIQALLAQDKLSMRLLRALDLIEDLEKRVEMASEAVAKGWSINETERRVRNALNPHPAKGKDSLLAQAEAHLPWEWLRDAVHFVRSISALRRAAKATLHLLRSVPKLRAVKAGRHFLRSVANLRAVKAAGHFLADFIPMRYEKLIPTARLKLQSGTPPEPQTGAPREPTPGEPPRSDDAQPPTTA